MSDEIRIMCGVDVDRRARPDEIGYCEACGAEVLIWELKPHLGEARCKDCRPFCAVCEDAEVDEEGDTCEECQEEARPSTGNAGLAHRSGSLNRTKKELT